MNTKNNKIEINEQFKKALDIIENSDKNVFITGKAGTGKSTLLSHFRSITKKKIVVLAPTGVAAINVSGETIHSFFGFKPDITLAKIKKIKDKNTNIYKKIDAIIIDEISMVRADLLDYVDHFLRLNGKNSNLPFGGTQMIFIGDLYQLPPVVTSREKEIFRLHYQSSYFFDSNVFKNLSIEFVELEKIYRQKDETFVKILNSIRNNSITEDGLSLLNQRVGVNLPINKNSGYTVHLTTTNKAAAEINNKYLYQLKTNVKKYQADVDGDFSEQSYPTGMELQIGVGAQVMLLNNDSGGRWMNGTLGEVTKIKYNKEVGVDIIYVRLADGNVEEVLPHTWDIFHFAFNENTKTIETETVGSFTQYPLKLAWSITIHKSQGKTFERVIIDISGTFAHGQAYVALSRCVSLDGIVLIRPLKKSYILMDWRVVKFMTDFQYNLSAREMKTVNGS